MISVGFVNIWRNLVRLCEIPLLSTSLSIVFGPRTCVWASPAVSALHMLPERTLSSYFDSLQSSYAGLDWD